MPELNGQPISNEASDEILELTSQMNNSKEYFERKDLEDRIKCLVHNLLNKKNGYENTNFEQ